MRGKDKVSIAMADISRKLDYRKQKLDALWKATSWYKELLGIHCEYSNNNNWCLHSLAFNSLHLYRRPSNCCPLTLEWVLSSERPINFTTKDFLLHRHCYVKRQEN